MLLPTVSYLSTPPHPPRFRLGWTPLHHACHGKYEDVARKLLERADVYEPPWALTDDDAALGEAACVAKTVLGEVVEAAMEGLIRSGDMPVEDAVVVHVPNDDGNTPLHLAALNGMTAVVDLLLTKGAPIVAANNNGLSPLHNVCLCLLCVVCVSRVRAAIQRHHTRHRLHLARSGVYKRS